MNDKKLRLDIASHIQSLERGEPGGELTSVEWCSGAAQLANCMTKRGAGPHELLNVLRCGTFTHGW